MNSLNDIWDSVLAELGKNLTATALNTWFSDCTPVELRNDRLILHTANEFKREVITSRFAEGIAAAASDIFSTDIMVTVLAGDELEPYLSETRPSSPTDPITFGGYTFQNFVVGPSNRYAHAAAVAVAETPGMVYNPLFIYGNSGLGKTHLLMAIGRYVSSQKPGVKMVYVKGADFTNELVRAIREGTTEAFRSKYCSADLLLMDDIQFIAGKIQTEEEFFHTFNALFEANKQIVVTSDRPPMEMSKLEDRLRTRLEWGLLADVQPPDLETRMAIIRNKSMQLGMSLPDDVVEFIAETITSNVRQIEGVVHKLTAFRNLMGEDITVTSAKKAVKDVIIEGPYVPTSDVIIAETARYYGIEESAVRGQSRQKNIVNARQMAMYLCRTLTSASLEDIGRQFENRNHATVLAAIRKVEEGLKSSKDVSAAVRDITSNISSKN